MDCLMLGRKSQMIAALPFTLRYGISNSAFAAFENAKINTYAHVQDKELAMLSMRRILLTCDDEVLRLTGIPPMSPGLLCYVPAWVS